MKRGRRFLSAVCVMAMLCMLVGTAFAAEATMVPENRELLEGEIAPGVQPRENAVYYYQNDTIYNGRSTNSFYFRLDEEFQYAKIIVKNTGSHAFVLSTEYTGGEFGSSYTVAAGKSTTIYVTGNGATGSFWANTTNTEGDLLYGTITILVGTKTGVGYPW